MILGSHNSWSFAKMEKWYFPHFICKCQNLNILGQLNRNVTVFDLRLRLRKDGTWGVSHGFGFFKVDFYRDLAYLNGLSKPIYIRILLEYNKKPKKEEEIINQFIKKCEELEKEFPNLYFFGGQMKYNWKKVFNFTHNDLPLIDLYSSTTSWFKFKNNFLKIIDDWWPWLYARFHNKRNLEKYANSDKCLLIDFIDVV